MCIAFIRHIQIKEIKKNNIKVHNRSVIPDPGSEYGAGLIRNPDYLNTWIHLFFILLFLFFLPRTIRAEEIYLPFQPGEKLFFELKWSLIPAGEAVLEVLPTTIVNGVECHHFVLTANTNTFVDNFYKVRDRIDAFEDIKMTRSLFFKKKQREGRSIKDIMIEFDWNKNQAQYSNFGDKLNPIPILPGTFDPLSAFYYTRMFNWSEHKEVQRPVTDGKKRITGKAVRIKRQTIKVPAGTFDTYLFEPDIEHVGGIFERSKNAKIELWVTADKNRIPVKLKSKVVVGSFTGELVFATGVNK